MSRSKLCPLFDGECLEHSCAWYTQLQGQNPQTGAQEDEWGCAVAWIPILLIENAATMRRVHESTEQHRAMDSELYKSQALREPTESLLRMIGVAHGRHT